MKKFFKKRSGHALFTATLTGILIIALSGILLSYLDNELRVRKATEDRIAAKYVAEAGVEHFLYMYENNLAYSINPFKTYEIERTPVQDEEENNLGYYSVTYTPPPNEDIIAIIESEGTTTGNNIVKIKVELDIMSGNIQSWVQE